MTTLKMALLAPMPSASVTRAAAVKAGRPPHHANRVANVLFQLGEEFRAIHASSPSLVDGHTFLARRDRDRRSAPARDAGRAPAFRLPRSVRGSASRRERRAPHRRRLSARDRTACESGSSGPWVTRARARPAPRTPRRRSAASWRFRRAAACGPCASTSRTWPGDCFPTRPSWRRSSRALRGDAGRDRACPRRSRARRWWRCWIQRATP